ncbi:NKG2-A/NKG2-B type II integral membrane protein-like [Carlito syrichta]|uniref:NKG2-A/NKG2-B type II integral membrane protein-like n=1 Tax=Carlito syrichta TaxID=1868482 RepID=A0A3Q0EC31_CARSF|nr:NKG2-A/NKG2-B type II integral membrane protein-like [Carlito syrichta]
MDNQGVIYSEMNFSQNLKSQERKSKENKSTILVTEQEIIYADLNLQTASQDIQDNEKTTQVKDLSLPPEKLISGILGIICFALIVTMVTRVISISIATQKQINSFQNASNQKGT